MLSADKVSTVHMSLSKSSLIFLTSHAWDSDGWSCPEFILCMAYWAFEENTASKSLFLKVFFSCCSIFPVSTSFTCRAFLSNYDLHCSIAQHFELWDFALPHSSCLVPTFISYNSCVGISPSSSSDSQTNWAGGHHFQKLQSVGYKQPFMAASLIPPPTFISAPQYKADTWALFPWTVLQIPSLSASPCAIVVALRLSGREVSRDMHEIC